ncbi:MAG: antibiotic biosynthesis monooxygenase [Jaaginema sp. PMC 1079.18]|nr:antibiotic biosynthesis monooxygenase [Jaaginema sp. PMC 1080.18]MEC4851987.1 antibiotic biosynthesis monooxygenase [Jaaginema sp. PMC 1079.18]MEC4868683.1 antibiotic biosynthesis monooxygenase [Jaaginema sp. PMC 1078.18]
MNAPGDRAPEEQNQYVTAVITHRVRSGRETGYEAWIRGISADARQFAGHLGVNILRPQPGASSDYVIVLQFASCPHLDDWLNSDIRKGWIERVQPLIHEPESIQVLTGLEGWFQLPTQTSPKAPKRYKQAILIWVGVMIVSLLVSPWIAPFLEPLPWILRSAINAAITVFLLSYAIMPHLSRWFTDWLFD